MARYTGAKDRLSRREGFDLFGKGSKLTRLNITPGVHGPKGNRGSVSQFGKQLREKQKVKRAYGLMEKQFRKYIEVAMKTKGNTVNALFDLLERRLDNTIFRLGFAKTRMHARQLVGHRHVLVNGKKVNIPSYLLQVGDSVTITTKAAETASVASMLSNKDFKAPTWLEKKGAAGQVLRKPDRSDVPEAFNDSDVIEFYSR